MGYVEKKDVKNILGIWLVAQHHNKYGKPIGIELTMPLEAGNDLVNLIEEYTSQLNGRGRKSILNKPPINVTVKSDSTDDSGWGCHSFATLEVNRRGGRKFLGEITKK